MKNIQKAYEILDKTFNDDAYSNLLMQHITDDYNVGFITQLVYGTLRNYRLVRAGWKQFVKDDLDDDISVLLDLGVYMINDIKNTPDYAIVNSVVEISKSISHQKYTKLVNAVLKKYIREGMYDLGDSLEDLSIKYSNPLWLSNMWSAHYGLETTLELLKYNITESALTLRVNTHKISKQDLLHQDDKFSEGVFSPEEVYYSGNIFKTDYFSKGYVSVQDAASQRVAHYVDAQASDKVLDACSAPGTKTFHIASLRADEGVIDAVELYDNRAMLIDQDKHRLGLDSVTVYVNDARSLHEFLEVGSYDKVLVDAPCTGFGVMRSKPEIKITTKPEDIDDITILQAAILDSAIKMAKVGGEIIYSTCTLNKKENENQVLRILKNNENMKLMSEETIFGFKHNSDSFYIAKLTKTSE